MDITKINTLLIQNNYYRKDWIYLQVSENTSVFYLKKFNLIIKIYKLIDQELNILDTNNFLNLDILKYSKFGYCNSFRELFILTLMKDLIDKKICINYPILVTYKYLNRHCNHCDKLLYNKINKYTDINKHIKKYCELQLMSKRLLLIFKEYIPYSLLEIFHTKQSDEFWIIFLFQILYTLYINNTKLDLINYDIHINNIYYKKVKPGGFTYYKIKKQVYKIPNIGYIFIIIDYGNCLTPKFNLSSKELEYYKLLNEYHYDVKSFIYNFNNQYILKNLILLHYNKIKQRLHKSDLSYYNHINSESKKFIGKTNLSFNYFIKYFFIKKLVNYKKIYKLFDKKIYYPNTVFLKIINKYIKFNLKKKYFKLNPKYIINTEYSKYVSN